MITKEHFDKLLKMTMLEGMEKEEYDELFSQINSIT
jgi:Asp-tRNA(Asn)/Glu-tRNA(Gln) amidotransferase C subunit